MKKTVGIITIQGRYNYGNRLQNYATCAAYETLGAHPVSLMLNRDADLLTRLRSFAKQALGRGEALESTISRDRLAAFDNFNRLIAFQEVTHPGTDQTAKFDYISVGSDQIWAFKRFAYNEDWAYLQFATNDQKIALAPSFGLDSITRTQAIRLRRYLKGFKYLSVREDSGAAIIRNATGRNAEVICDPTLAVRPSCWRKLASDACTPASPYVLSYILGDTSGEAGEALSEIVAKKALTVVPLSDKERKGEPPAGPAEFISLIDHAEHVITDSFHAAVFSALFETPLTIVHRSGGDRTSSRMFGRLETLADSLGIAHKIYASPDFNLSLAGDYEGVSEAIAHERERFMNYLEACLNA